MPFDLQLTIGVSSRSVSHALNRPRRRLIAMNEWLKEELAELEHAEEEKQTSQQRLEMVKQQATRLWEGLKVFIKDAIEKMNRSGPFTKKTGGLDYTDHGDRIEVHKTTFPRIYLTVKPGPITLDIHRKIVTNGANSDTQEQTESLSIELDDNGHPYFLSKDVAPMVLDEVVRYILKPFINPEVLKLTRPMKFF